MQDAAQKQRALEDQLRERARARKREIGRKESIRVTKPENVDSAFEILTIDRTSLLNEGSADLRDVVVTKIEEVDIREALVVTESLPTLGQQWVPSTSNLTGLIASVVIIVIATIYWFSSHRSVSSKFKKKSKLSAPPIKSHKDLFDALTEAQDIVFELDRGEINQSRVKELMRTFEGGLAREEWSEDKEQLASIIGQLWGMYTSADKLEKAVDRQLDINRSMWIIPLLSSLELAEKSHRLLKAEKDMLAILDTATAMSFDAELRVQLQSRAELLREESDELTTSTENRQLGQVMALLRETRQQRHEASHERKENAIERRKTNALRDLDRLKMRVKDSLVDNVQVKKELKAEMGRRVAVVHLLNRAVFTTTYIIALGLYLSTQTKCNLQNGLVKFAECNAYEVLGTSCSYLRFDVQAAQAPSQHWMGLLDTWNDLMHSPTETLYTIAVQLPVSFAAAQVLPMLGLGSMLFGESADTIICMVHVLLRFLPSFFVQGLFNLVYCPGLGGAFSWPLVAIFYWDVVERVLKGPLWPVLILTLIQLLTYVSSLGLNKVDISWQLIIFYSIYITVVLSFPYAWPYADQLRSLR